MSEFKHWLDESSEATDFERAVLHSGLDSDPSETQREEVWVRVLGSLSLAPLGAAANLGPALEPTVPVAKSAVGATKALSVWLGVGKGFVVGLALYGAGVEASTIAARLRTPLAAPGTAVVLAPVRARVEPALPLPSGVPVLVNPSLEPTTRRATPSTSESATAVLPSETSQGPSVAAFAMPSATFAEARGNRASQLEAEARLLRDARAALRAGRYNEAFASLEASRRQFSALELDQEREALTIELLARGGQPEAATQRAKAFLNRFPDSPHASRVRQFAVR